MIPTTSHFRIQRIAPGESAAAWAAELATFDTRTARVLKQEGGSAVYQARLLGRDVVLKVRELRGLRDCLKLWTHTTRGFRHWNNARWLTSHGFATAKTCVLATERRAGAKREWLVLDLLEGKTLLQHIADRDLSVRQEHEVARILGRQVSAIRLAGRSNRDHKPSNLILMPDGNGLTPAIIDCVAIERGGYLDSRMLHALAVEPLGLGILPRRALRARVIHELVKADFQGDPALTTAASTRGLRTSRRMFWRVVTESLQQHGDPTPRTDPLAPPRLPPAPPGQSHHP